MCYRSCTGIIIKYLKCIPAWRSLINILIFVQCIHTHYADAQINKKYSTLFKSPYSTWTNNQQKHAIIFYKEDFVNEDYDPKNQQLLVENEINVDNSKVYNGLKPEKLLFDFLSNDSDNSFKKFSEIDHFNFEITSLADTVAPNFKSNLKNGLIQKSRTKRSSDEEMFKIHTIRKRTPYHTANMGSANQIPPAHNYIRHPVKGNYFNTISLPGAMRPSVSNRFGGEDETDRVVWGISFLNPVGRLKPTPPPRRAPPPLVYDPNPKRENMQRVTTSPTHFNSRTRDNAVSEQFMNNLEIAPRFYIGNRF